MVMAIGIGYKMKKTKETPTQFTIIGRGEFPLDMLRYDGCYPKLETDTAIMRKDGLREVTLQRGLDHDNYRPGDYGNPTVWSPTVGRWNSFGWAVLSDLPIDRFGAGALTHNSMLIARLRTPMKRRASVGVSTPTAGKPTGAEYRPGGRRPTSPDGTDWGIYGESPREQWNGVEWEAYHEQEGRDRPILSTGL